MDALAPRATNVFERGMRSSGLIEAASHACACNVITQLTDWLSHSLPTAVLSCFKAEMDEQYDRLISTPGDSTFKTYIEPKAASVHQPTSPLRTVKSITQLLARLHQFSGLDRTRQTLAATCSWFGLIAKSEQGTMNIAIFKQLARGAAAWFTACVRTHYFDKVGLEPQLLHSTCLNHVTTPY